MNDQGPFDRILDSQGGGPQRDRSAQWIFIGMGLVGVVLFILVASPFSIFGGGGDGGSAIAPTGSSGSAAAGSSNTPKVPDGYEALSMLVDGIKKPENTQGPYELKLNLVQTLTDSRNLGLYTFQDGKWTRLASATLISNGTAVSGEVADIPPNVAVLRVTASAVQLTGVLPAGAEADPDALSTLSTINPAGLAPAADGSIAGTPAVVTDANGNVAPAVRAATPDDDAAVNTILASPGLSASHITALVQLALQPGNAGVDINYPRVAPARKADFTSFISGLADQLHQANRTLSVTLPTPTRSGVSWDTSAYDWQQLGAKADMLKLTPVNDPSAYYARMTEVLDFLKTKVDLKKVALVVTRQSYEKASDGLQAMTLNDGLSLASQIDVRTTTAITPNSAVVIVGTNIFQDDGASGVHWDSAASAVSFEYPGKGGQRTVWLENSLSLAFRLDLASRYGLGGVAVDDISNNAALPAIWSTLRGYADSGTATLVLPNDVLLRPTWDVQAGNSQAETKGNLVWTAPAQPGPYDIGLVVSDGVILAEQKVSLTVKAASPSP